MKKEDKLINTAEIKIINPLHEEFKIINNESAGTLMVNYIIDDYNKKLIEFLNDELKEVQEVINENNGQKISCLSVKNYLIEFKKKIKDGDFR